MWVLLRPHDSEEPSHASDYDIGLDIAKSVFQVHGVDAAGNVIIRRQLKAALCTGILSETTTTPGWH